MKVQWQARTFYSFDGGGKENIIVYDVPFEGTLDTTMMYYINGKIENGKTVWAQQINNNMLRVAIKFN